MDKIQITMILLKGIKFLMVLQPVSRRSAVTKNKGLIKKAATEFEEEFNYQPITRRSAVKRTHMRNQTVSTEFNLLLVHLVIVSSFSMSVMIRQHFELFVTVKLTLAL